MSWLEEIEQRWAAATERPWDARDITRRNGPQRHQIRGDFERDLHTNVATVYHSADAKAIASAPSDIARLVAEVKRYQKLETAVRDWKRGSFTGEQDIDDALAGLDESEVRG